MINFKAFLQEARMAPLYHGTSLSNALEIINSGYFIPYTKQNSFALLKSPIKLVSFFGTKQAAVKNFSTNKYISGLSTTRNYNFSYKWVTINLAMPPENVVIFEFDQQMITHKYQIKPIEFSQLRNIHDLAEYEEFIITDKPIPLKYVTKIFAGQPDIIYKLPKLPKNIQVFPLK